MTGMASRIDLIASEQERGPGHAQVLTRRAAAGILLAALAAGALAGPALAADSTESTAHPAPPKPRFVTLDPARAMPMLKLFHVNGKPVDVAPRPGRAMLVNLWATWCDTCGKELLQLENVQKSLGNTLDVVAIAHDGGGQSVVEPFLRKQGIKRLDVYLDPDGLATAVATQTQQAGPFVLYSTPTSYLITPHGHIVGYVAGAVDWTSQWAQTLIENVVQAE